MSKIISEKINNLNDENNIYKIKNNFPSNDCQNKTNNFKNNMSNDKICPKYTGRKSEKL